MVHAVESTTSPARAWTPSELRDLPKPRRDAILAEAAARAEALYRTIPELTDFEAFGPDDLHGEGASASEG